MKLHALPDVVSFVTLRRGSGYFLRLHPRTSARCLRRQKTKRPDRGWAVARRHHERDAEMLMALQNARLRVSYFSYHPFPLRMVQKYGCPFHPASVFFLFSSSS